MAKFSDIPQFPKSTYAVDIGIHYIKETLKEYKEWGLNIDPDFQRGHVWTKQQQTAFLEFWFRGK